ncbi:hypothetical protein Bbelb_231390 [Branchiostoma belcheri]|nr:hypothetical protein Bbelb_231390 [Branchiostoma belcheri]
MKGPAVAARTPKQQQKVGQITAISPRPGPVYLPVPRTQSPRSFIGLEKHLPGVTTLCRTAGTSGSDLTFYGGDDIHPVTARPCTGEGTSALLRAAALLRARADVSDTVVFMRPKSHPFGRCHLTGD